MYTEKITKQVKDYEGWYEVDDDGTIRSLDRYVNHSKGGLALRKGRTLKQTKDKDGYPTVHLTKNSKARTTHVHTIVAKAFPEICGEWFEGCEVDHIDTNKQNCSAYNLRVVTPKQNTNNPLTLQHKSIARTGIKHTDETKRKISLNQIGRVSPMKGRHHTDEAKEKNRQAHIGVPSKKKGKKYSKNNEQRIY